jgi:hypothetical protein
VVERQKELLDSSLKYKWLTSTQNDGKLYKSSELWSTEFQDHVSFVEPIVNNSVVPKNFHSTLLIRDALNIDVVFSNYMHIVTRKNQNDTFFIETNVIKNIYSYFKDSKNEQLIRNFDVKKSENFIFTFDKQVKIIFLSFLLIQK